MADSGRLVRTRSRTLVVVVCVLALVAACTRESSSSHADGHAVVVEPDQRLDVSIPGVVDIDGPAGSFAKRETLRFRAVDADLSLDKTYARVAGAGVDVEFTGKLERPLSLAFAATRRPGPDWQPFALHQRHNGEWEAVAATYRDARIVVETNQFSINVPTWLNPKRWIGGLVHEASQFLTGHTDPDPCPPAGKPGPPAWADLTGPNTSAVHTCLFENSDSRGQRVEVQFKSNRGVFVVVTQPPGADYVWQDTRSRVATAAGRHTRLIGNDEFLLAPEDRMSFGVRRSGQDVTPSLWVRGTHATTLLSAVSALLGERASWPVVAECLASDAAAGRITIADFKSVVTCGLDVLAQLSDDPTKARTAAREALGPALDNATLSQQAELLTEEAKKFKGIGGFVKGIGFALEVGPIWLQATDELLELIDSNHTLVQLTVRATPKPAVRQPALPVPGPAPAAEVPSPSPSPAPPNANTPASETTSSPTPETEPTPTQDPPPAPKPTISNFQVVVYEAEPGHVGVSYNVGWQEGRDPVTCHFFIDGSEVFTAQCGTHSSKQFYGLSQGNHSFYATVSDRFGVYSDPSPAVVRYVPGQPPAPPKPTVSNFQVVLYGGGHVGVSYNVGWQEGRDPVTCHFFIDGREVFTAQCGTHSSKQFYGLSQGNHSFYATVSDRFGVYSDPSPTITKYVT